MGANKRKGGTMKKVLIICTSGLGTSLMISINLETIFKEVGIKAKIQITDTASIKFYNPDLLIGQKAIIESLTLDHKAEVLALKSIVDKNELKEKIMKSKILWSGN